MGYVRTPVQTDPILLAEDVFSYINGLAPRWAPSEGNLDVWIIRAVASLAAENRSIASDVQDDIYRYFGASLVGIAPITSQSALGTTTWIMIDSLGHTIPAGANVGLVNPAGDVIAFQTLDDVVIPAGQTATAAGAIRIIAITPGVDANNLGTVGGAVQLIDVIDFVSSITITGPTAGGVEEEADDDYLNRLTRELQRFSRRPILPADFASMTLDADPIIQRAVAIDGYNPADSTYNNQRMVTVAAVDANGNAVGTAVKNEITALLQANREINFIVNVIDPTYTTINVVTQVHNLIGYTDAAVEANITAAIHAYLDPANWGKDPTVATSAAAQTWVESTTVYYNEMITVISNAQGVDRVISLTLNGGTANVAVTTPAALTRVGTITITHA